MRADVEAACKEAVLRSLSCVGEMNGQPIRMKFITQAEWDAVPPGEKPPALKLEGLMWYAVFVSLAVSAAS